MSVHAPGDGRPVRERLSAPSAEAHDTAAAGDTDRVRQIEAAMDRAAAGLTGLTLVEVEEVQEHLAELWAGEEHRDDACKP